MKKLFFLVIISFFAVVANAQEIFQKGTNIVNLGVGLGSHIPVEVSFEHSIVDGLIQGENGAIGVGAYAGWYSYSDSYAGGKLRYNDFVIGARGTFHYQFVDKLDTYAGVMLGYDIVSSKWDGNGLFEGSTSASAFSSSFFLGARYYFAPSIAAYSELGYGIAYLSVGVALKF
ncbi:MAG: hypothetical protein LBB84_10035 [Tannerellaceae bacterium]|jgi:hypothetical protein|nr:hypothetical protein [Tannerellaceae bacterium]